MEAYGGLKAERSLPCDLIPLREAAALGGVHPKTIRRWISSDLLNGYRRGPRLIYVSRSELLDLAQPLDAGGVA
ncbi:helix-turn-helix domain-containing protein [Nocardia sp. NPDC003482]